MFAAAFYAQAPGPARSAVLACAPLFGRIASLLLAADATASSSGGDGDDPRFASPSSFVYGALSRLLCALEPGEAASAYLSLAGALGAQSATAAAAAAAASTAPEALLLRAASRPEWASLRRGWALGALAGLAAADWSKAGLRDGEMSPVLIALSSAEAR